MQRVLITGGAGFLGSHLCDRLLERGCEVWCLDNLLTGTERNIAHLLGHPRFRFIRYNVCEYVYVQEPVDAVLHFASPASPKDYLEYPIHTLKVGAFGTHKALGLARAKGARFLLASTSEVYGDPLVNPQPETYWGNVSPISPRGVYDEAKRFAEAMTMAYHRYHGLDTRIVRIFNTYGPRMRPQDGRVISTFITQALAGRPLTVHGDGTQTRSFCYVDDMVEGILGVLFCPSDRSPEQRTDRAFLRTNNEHEDSIHHPINLGNPEEHGVLEVARLVLEVTGSPSAVEFHPRPVDDPRVRRPDIRRAQRLLGWTPRVGLRDGLARTVAYFRGRLERPAVV
ncbi:MAG: SDR family oxidoreductase [Armatimonadota bacterium]|nr:SDR family oxidoreductase [Armatimonadota bacterium]MDR7536506.1 SDR family oxidoreductase [Armatimonadota bacterium]